MANSCSERHGFVFRRRENTRTILLAAGRGDSKLCQARVSALAWDHDSTATPVTKEESWEKPRQSFLSASAHNFITARNKAKTKICSTSSECVPLFAGPEADTVITISAAAVNHMLRAVASFSLVSLLQLTNSLQTLSGKTEASLVELLPPSRPDCLTETARGGLQQLVLAPHQPVSLATLWYELQVSVCFCSFTGVDYSSKSTPYCAHKQIAMIQMCRCASAAECRRCSS